MLSIVQEEAVLTIGVVEHDAKPDPRFIDRRMVVNPRSTGIEALTGKCRATASEE